jgi:hypothetical protein
MDRVIVAEADEDLVPCEEPEDVLETLVLPDPVTLAVDVLELVILREELGEDVLVLEADTLGVPVFVSSADSEPLPVFVKEGDAEDVLDEAMVRLCVTLAVPVLEEEADLEPVELADGLLEDVIEEVPVRVGAVVRVLVVDPVIVFVIIAELLRTADALAVLDATADLVPATLRTLVKVYFAVGVNISVGRTDLVPVVVRVDVFDIVALALGKTISPTKIRASSRGSPEDTMDARKNNKSCNLRILLFYTYDNHLDTSFFSANKLARFASGIAIKYVARSAHPYGPSLSLLFPNGTFIGVKGLWSLVAFLVYLPNPRECLENSTFGRRRSRRRRNHLLFPAHLLRNRRRPLNRPSLGHTSLLAPHLRLLRRLQPFRIRLTPFFLDQFPVTLAPIYQGILRRLFGQ